MKIKAVIFDLDGTLYDNSRLPLYMVLGNLFNLKLLYYERLARHEISGNYYGRHGMAYAAFFKRVSRLSGYSVDKVEKWYWSKYMPMQAEVLKKHCKVKKWVLPLLEKLKAEGIKTAVFSEYSYVAEKLEAIGLKASMFDYITDAASAGGFKPCLKAFKYVSAKLKVYPADIMVVGDREDTDGAGAQACNMQFTLVDKGDADSIELELENKEM